MLGPADPPRAPLSQAGIRLPTPLLGLPFPSGILDAAEKEELLRASLKGTDPSHHANFRGCCWGGGGGGRFSAGSTAELLIPGRNWAPSPCIITFCSTSTSRSSGSVPGVLSHAGWVLSHVCLGHPVPVPPPHPRPQARLPGGTPQQDRPRRVLPPPHLEVLPGRAKGHHHPRAETLPFFPLEALFLPKAAAALVSHPARHRCRVPGDPLPPPAPPAPPAPASCPWAWSPSLPVGRQHPHHRRKNPKVSSSPCPPSDPADPSPSPPSSAAAQPLAGSLGDRVYLPAEHPTAYGVPQVKCAVKSLLFQVGGGTEDLALIIPLGSGQQQGCRGHLQGSSARARGRDGDFRLGNAWQRITLTLEKLKTGRRSWDWRPSAGHFAVGVRPLVLWASRCPSHSQTDPSATLALTAWHGPSWKIPPVRPVPRSPRRVPSAVAFVKVPRPTRRLPTPLHPVPPSWSPSPVQFSKGSSFPQDPAWASPPGVPADGDEDPVLPPQLDTPRPRTAGWGRSQPAPAVKPDPRRSQTHPTAPPRGPRPPLCRYQLPNLPPPVRASPRECGTTQRALLLPAFPHSNSHTNPAV